MVAVAAQYRALVVDDEPLVRQALVRALRCENFECEPAANGREALEWMSEFQYDLVVTDLRMPEHNGHALAVDLLALPDRPVVVVLTGVLEPRIANDLRVRGVDEVLFKPVDFRILAKRARGLVEARETEEQIAFSEGEGGEEASDEAAKPAQEPNDLQNVGDGWEEPPIQQAEVPQLGDTSTPSRAKQQSDQANDQHRPTAQLSEKAKSPRARALATTEFGKHSIASANESQRDADRSTNRVSANTPPLSHDAHDVIAGRVRTLADQLQDPPESYDGFAIASKRGFCIPDLGDAILRDPALIHDVLRMANGVLYGASQALRDMQGSAAVPQPHRTVQQPVPQHPLTLVIIFALGIGLGWLLSWLGPAVWLR